MVDYAIYAKEHIDSEHVIRIANHGLRKKVENDSGARDPSLRIENLSYQRDLLQEVLQHIADYAMRMNNGIHHEDILRIVEQGIIVKKEEKND